MADAWREARAAAPAREDGTPRVTAALVREAAEAVRERRPARSHAEAHAERLAAVGAAVAGRGGSPAFTALPYDRVVRGVDAGEYLRALPDGCADVAITSPPYWMKRRYLPGDPRELGQEPDPADYVDRLCAVLDEVGRVLAPAGTLWLNLGDTLGSQPGGYRGDPARRRGLSAQAVAANATAPAGRELDVPAKSFCLIPETVALRLVLDSGWRLLAKIAWVKARAPTGERPRPLHPGLGAGLRPDPRPPRLPRPRGLGPAAHRRVGHPGRSPGRGRRAPGPVPGGARAPGAAPRLPARRRRARPLRRQRHRARGGARGGPALPRVRPRPATTPARRRRAQGERGVTLPRRLTGAHPAPRERRVADERRRRPALCAPGLWFARPTPSPVADAPAPGRPRPRPPSPPRHPPRPEPTT